MNTIDEFIKYITANGNFSSNEHITLQSIADAYLYLLEQARKSQEEKLKIIDEVRTNAYNQANASALENNWVSIDKLRTMSIAEVANLITND